MNNITLLKADLNDAYKSNEKLIKYIEDISQKQSRVLPNNTITQRHHIIPTCMGGADVYYNYVILTIDEHIKYHIKLAECFDIGEVERYHNMCSANILQVWLTDVRLNIDMSGINNPMFGKHHTNETKLKIGKKSKEKIYTDEYRKRLSLATRGINNPMHGRTHSAETRQKISEAQIGKTRKPHTADTILKMKLASTTTVSVGKYSADGVFIEKYKSIATAADDNNISSGNLSMYFKKPYITKYNKIRLLGGFIWKFA